MKNLARILFALILIPIVTSCGDSKPVKTKACEFNPSGINFSNVQLGTSKSATVTITCSEDTVLNASWSGNSEYRISPPLQTSYSLQANTPLEITVSTNYSMAGGKTSALDFVAGNGDEYQYLIIGNATTSSDEQSFLRFSQDSIVLNTSVGNTARQTITATNNTNARFMVLNSEIIIDNGDATALQEIKKGPVECAITSLNPGESCIVNVEFSPTVPKNYTGNLSFSIRPEASTRAFTQDVPLTATVQ